VYTEPVIEITDVEAAPFVDVTLVPVHELFAPSVGSVADDGIVVPFTLVLLLSAVGR
jgi:hypothetical protein